MSGGPFARHTPRLIAVAGRNEYLLGRRKMMATTQQSPAQSSATSWLTSDEMRVLEAVCDTLIPSLSPPEGDEDRKSVV